MSIPLWVTRASVYSEFPIEKQQEFFDLKQKKVISDYDNFYYTVFLSGDDGSEKLEVYQKHVEAMQKKNTLDYVNGRLKGNEFVEDKVNGISGLIGDLNKRRAAFDFKSQDVIDFYGLDYYPFGLKFYNNKLSLSECFDILICDTLPNPKTPRIMVQLRARYLWLFGFEKCFRESLEYLQRILMDFDIDILRVQENRIDYAFHTNCIQNFEKFFDRRMLVNSCRTNSRIYNHVGDPQHDWSIDYLSIGSRSAKSVFFRAYNKTREVVEKAYKTFFLELWFKHGLISAYDKYCLEIAFQRKSYDVGLLIGRICWYLEFGSDEFLKQDLEDLVKKCYADNCNSSEIRKQISGVLPEVTVICNLEFETHTDFYRSFDKSLLDIPCHHDFIYSRVRKIYECRKAFVDYLTSYDGSLAFVDNLDLMQEEIKRGRNKFTKTVNKVRIFDEEGFYKWREKYIDSHYSHFWKRLRSCKLNTEYNPDLYRTYERKIDVERVKRKVVTDIATLSIHRNGINDCFDLNADISDFYSLLNDNDMHFIGAVSDSGELAEIKYGDYYTVKQRKNRQYRSVVSSPDQVDDKSS